MPTVNIFSKHNAIDKLSLLIPELKIFLAKKLTCGDIKLSPKEISIRLINSEANGMIGDIEIEIKAHAFAERVKKQDDICNEVRKYLMKKKPSLGDIRVWLVLSELGHSW